MAIYLILYNVRSAHNVGSIFRTADGAGVTKLFLVGYTPQPIDRFGRVQPKIAKTALGATASVAWEYHENIESVFSALKRSDVQIVAVEQHTRAIPYTEFEFTHDTAFIVGNEIAGVPTEICERAAAVVYIPMLGLKESLNVSVATGVVLFHAATKNISTKS